MKKIQRYRGPFRTCRELSNLGIILLLLGVVIAPSGCQLFSAHEPENGVPTTPQIAVAPTLPTTSDDLSCEIITPSTDPDGDTIIYSYQWYKEGELQPGLTESAVAAEDTADGETWRRVVTPNDGRGEG